MTDEGILQCKYLEVPAHQIAAMCISSVDGHWSIISSDLPHGAEYVGSWYNRANDSLRIFFYHESFPVSASADKIPGLPPPIIKSAERAQE